MKRPDWHADLALAENELHAVLGRQPVPLTRIHTTRALATSLDDVITHAVKQARENGESWTAIGHALGITKQAAQQRYGDL